MVDNNLAKIAIITFHRANNFGAVLQAYALQSTINDLGHRNVIIDYRCNYVERLYRPFIVYDISLYGVLKSMILIVPLMVRNVRFSKFRKEKLVSTSKEYSSLDIYEISDLYQIYITGSDMVWHWHNYNNVRVMDYNFFLSFVNDDRDRNSYAASFGTDELPLDIYKECSQYLSRFKNISVREKSAQKIITNMLCRESTVCLDPVLLLEKRKWLKLIGKNKRKKPYLVLYSIVKPTNTSIIANKIADELGVEVIQIMASASIKGIVNGRILNSQGPIQFLELIYYSEFVVTSSFHGTAFAVLFNKPFIVDLYESGTYNNRSSELLELIGLKHRAYESTDLKRIALETINWESVNKKIEDERRKSLMYINKVIGSY